MRVVVSGKGMIKIKFKLFFRSQLGPILELKQALLLVLNSSLFLNPPTYRRTVIPNWHLTQFVPNFGLQSRILSSPPQNNGIKQKQIETSSKIVA